MKNDGAYLLDVLESAKSIRAYLVRVSVEDFKANTEKQDAVNRRIEIIGEATRHLSPQARAQFPEIPWKLISSMRNILIHDYDDVDVQIVWDTTQKDIPPLIVALEDYFAKLPPTDS
jgi:uncharacterized protein with HEPN domain